MKKIHLKSPLRRVTHPRSVCCAFMSSALKIGPVAKVTCCKCQVAFIKAVIKKENWVKKYKKNNIPWITSLVNKL